MLSSVCLRHNRIGEVAINLDAPETRHITKLMCSGRPCFQGLTGATCSTLQVPREWNHAMAMASAAKSRSILPSPWRRIDYRDMDTARTEKPNELADHADAAGSVRVLPVIRRFIQKIGKPTSPGQTPGTRMSPSPPRASQFTLSHGMSQRLIRQAVNKPHENPEAPPQKKLAVAGT